MPSVHSAVFDLLISNEENIPCVRQRVVSTLPRRESGTARPALFRNSFRDKCRRIPSRVRARVSNDDE